MSPRTQKPSLALVHRVPVEERIRRFRGEKVILDADLAELYGVPVKRLNEAVRRNRTRFPADFMFQLSHDEFANLRSQIATSSWGGRRYQPHAFTEHGAIMVAAVLNSEQAVAVSVMVVRAFVRLRQLLVTHAELARKLDELERKYDAQFQGVFDAIRQLMAPPFADATHRRIGFQEGSSEGEQAPA
jgi:ORF6N domain